MLIRKKKLKEIITKVIITTARQCGRNLPLKDRNKILNSALERR